MEDIISSKDLLDSLEKSQISNDRRELIRQKIFQLSGEFQNKAFILRYLSAKAGIGELIDFSESVSVYGRKFTRRDLRLKNNEEAETELLTWHQNQAKNILKEIEGSPETTRQTAP